jgi:Na+-driven multidrug efflux pump
MVAKPRERQTAAPALILTRENIPHNLVKLALAGSVVRIGALKQLPIAVQMVISGGLRGAGDMRTPMYATLLGTLFFRVPIVYLFAVVWGWGLDGVWLGTALDWTARAAPLYFLFRRGAWKKIRL